MIARCKPRPCVWQVFDLVSISLPQMRSVRLATANAWKAIAVFIRLGMSPVGADFRRVPNVSSKTDLRPVSIVSSRAGRDSTNALAVPDGCGGRAVAIAPKRTLSLNLTCGSRVRFLNFGVAAVMTKTL